MASTQKRASTRWQHAAGNAAHDAEQRVHKRVIEIMARRAAAERRESRLDQTVEAHPRGSVTDRS
jgi:hypothetical protein